MGLKKFKSLSIYFSLPESKIQIWVPFNTIESILNFNKSFFEVFFKFRYFNSS